MKDGFIKTAAVVPAMSVGDTAGNTSEIIRCMKEAMAHEAKVIVFPELAITGYTCQDLFLQDALLRGAEEGLRKIRDASADIGAVPSDSVKMPSDSAKAPADSVIASVGTGTASAKSSAPSDAIVFVGFPLEWQGKLYNTAAVIQNGKILAFIPKRFLPNYAEFYEPRQFTAGPAAAAAVVFDGEEIPFGSHIILDVDAIKDLEIAAEICEDAWVMNAPHIEHALAGANLIVNLSASNETVGKDDYRRQLFSQISAQTLSDYIYVSSGDGESTQDIVFGGRIMMLENGSMLAERKIFDNAYGSSKICYADFDIQRMNYERRRMTTFDSAGSGDVHCGRDGEADGYLHIPVHIAAVETELERVFDPHPFVPSDKAGRDRRCEDILNIQSRGLARRLHAIHCDTAVIGVSGGLDSTLALLVTARAFDLLGLDRKNIIAVTMPAFGTTRRTHGNALTLASVLGATLREVNIEAAVTQHFRDIGQDMSDHDVTYENGQARERTQVLMDIANKTGGIVIGTGDLSELALGWATYNGDHMSMYGVNAGVPKTLVSHLVRYIAERAADSSAAGRNPASSAAGSSSPSAAAGGAGSDLSERFTAGSGRDGANPYYDPELSKCLLDVLDTPVSPELLPPTDDGKIAQKTEDLVGPYELHDYFLYYMLRCGYRPRKIYRIALQSFGTLHPSGAARNEQQLPQDSSTHSAGQIDIQVGQYDAATILKWEKNFVRRFFTQQFKRSCLPDSPKVGSVAVSPRGDLRMPSDAVRDVWMNDLSNYASQIKSL